jgi:hypothetical protein
MKVTHTFELYDPKKNSVRARCISARDIADVYIPNTILKKLNHVWLLGQRELKNGDKIYITYDTEAPNDQE